MSTSSTPHGPAAKPEAQPPPVSETDEATALGYLGLDVGQSEVTACLLLADGREAVRRWTVPNTRPGAEALVGRVGELAEQHRLGRLRIGLEATGLYWWPLACLLNDTPLWHGLQPAVYALNPKLVHGLKKVYGETGKTDPRDAFLIAERLRIGRLPAPFQLDLVYAPLQRLTRYRMHLSQTLAREKGYFLNLLFVQFSGFSQEKPFSDTFGPTCQALLEQFSTEELAQTAVEDLARFIHERGRGGFGDPEVVAASLRRAARQSYHLNSALQPPVELVLGMTRATIRILQAQLLMVDQTVARELRALPAHARTLDSVPGLGPVWTAGLVAEIGDIQRFSDDAALAKYAGLVWPPHESGEFQAQDSRLAKAGNAYLRYYLVEAANSVRQHCAEYRHYYLTKFVQSPKHAHQRALVLTARKLVRLVDALLRTGSVYRAPTSGQNQEEVRTTPPHAARPRPQRRARLVTSAS
jgi:transposase